MVSSLTPLETMFAPLALKVDRTVLTSCAVSFRRIISHSVDVLGFYPCTAGHSGAVRSVFALVLQVILQMVIFALLELVY